MVTFIWGLRPQIKGSYLATSNRRLLVVVTEGFPVDVTSSNLKLLLEGSSNL